MIQSMSMPGWYPDPAGGQGRYRYWDGNAWSDQTTHDPRQPLPPPQTRQRSAGRSGLNWLWIAAGVTVLTVLALLIWIFMPGGRAGGFVPVPEDTNSATPTIEGWDETSRPTPPPTTAASLVTCPYTTNQDQTKQGNDGRLRGGGLVVDRIDGWRDAEMYLQWVSDFNTQMDTVRPGWVSNIGVGQLNAEDGFLDPQTAARQSMECFASSGYYLNFTERIDLANEATTISGYPAWWIRSEVHIESADMPEIDGDVVDIIVVDLGDPERMGIFVSSVTIGDDRRQRLVDAAIDSLAVD